MMQRLYRQWLAKQEAKWQQASADLAAQAQAQLATQQAAVEAKQRTLAREAEDVEALLARNAERKVELARANEELRTQLRLVEAKAAPDHVWAEAFSLGFSKAWDLMLPLMREGNQKAYQVIFDEAVEQTLRGLEPAIQHRLEEAGHAALRPMNALLAKRDEFRAKAASALDATSKQKYQHYLTAIEWALESTNGH